MPRPVPVNKRVYQCKHNNCTFTGTRGQLGVHTKRDHPKFVEKVELPVTEADIKVVELPTTPIMTITRGEVSISVCEWKGAVIVLEDDTIVEFKSISDAIQFYAAQPAVEEVKEPARRLCPTEPSIDVLWGSRPTVRQKPARFLTRESHE